MPPRPTAGRRSAPTPMVRALSRRRFLTASLATSAAVAGGALVGCGGAGGGSGSATDDAGDGAAGSAPGVEEGYLLLQAGFADGIRVPSTLVAGRPQRAPFVLYGSDGIPAVNGIPESLGATLVGPDGTSSEVVLARRDAGIPTPYYPLLFEPTSSGLHRIELPVEGELQVVEFVVAEADTVALVQPGDPMRPVATPTTADALGYEPICTRFEPCPFHEVGLPDVLGNGRPTALLIATPGFCQTAICGPVIELIIEEGLTDVDVVHAEVYTEPDRLTEVADFTSLIGPVVTEYGMDFEPSLVVADGTDTVVARLDYTFDRTELRDALALTR